MSAPRARADGRSRNGSVENGAIEEPTGTSETAAETPSAGDASSHSGRWPSWLGRRLPQLLLLPDLIVLYLAFIGGMKARYGAWMLPQEIGATGPLLLSIATYVTALALAGLYRTSPRRMHLHAFLRAGVALLLGWAVSVTLAYLMFRTNIPPRSVTALQCLLAMIGILGLRALVRATLERYCPLAGASDVPTANPLSRSRGTAPADGLLQAEELLARPAVAVDGPALRDHLSGRTVLVTGAGGSIGTELTRQLLQLQPFRLVLVDISEYNLFQLENALRKTPFDGELEFCIADVRDASIMDGLFSEFHPDVVLHAAAYKHVPLMERHPIEAFCNNTLTTVTLLQLSRRYETEQFVFVSTDKAVEPSSVLGATKRLSEWYVQSIKMGPKCKIVRFGNVFGSQGSVVPLFEEQVRAGRRARVTHPDMERYFMSAHEACSLILQTLLLDTAPIYIFDMGDPVSIQWLAEEVVRRLRPDADPDDLIVHTGIRPGEKLSEKLTTPEERTRPTPHDRIIGLTCPPPYPFDGLAAHFQHLEALCDERRTAALRKALFATDLKAARRA